MFIKTIYDGKSMVHQNSPIYSGLNHNQNERGNFDSFSRWNDGIFEKKQKKHRSSDHGKRRGKGNITIGFLLDYSNPYSNNRSYIIIIHYLLSCSQVRIWEYHYLWMTRYYLFISSESTSIDIGNQSTWCVSSFIIVIVNKIQSQDS